MKFFGSGFFSALGSVFFGSVFLVWAVIVGPAIQAHSKATPAATTSPRRQRALRTMAELRRVEFALFINLKMQLGRSSNTFRPREGSTPDFDGRSAGLVPE